MKQLSLRSDMLQRHAKALKQLNNMHVEAGWFSTSRYAADENGRPGELIAQVMYWQEFGAGKIPPRPFMRLAATRIRSQGPKVMQKLTAKILQDEMTARQALADNGFGGFMVNMIVDSMLNGGWVGNSDITIHGTPPDKNGRQFIKGKGFDKPLVDTSAAMQQVSCQVV